MLTLPRWRGRRRGAVNGIPDDRAFEISQFWAWWQRHEHELRTQLVTGSLPSAETDRLAAAVRALHPDLVWEIGPGHLAEHALVVSAGGVAELRALAERWYRAGPGSGPVWEYHPARQAEPGRFLDTLDLDGRAVDLTRMVVGARADDQRAKLDVAVFHPMFPDLSPQARAQATFLCLDWALGEDDVERWIGAVEVAGDEPLDAVPVSSLGSVIAQLRERWGGERWILLEGETPSGARVLAAARHPLSRVDHPLLDEHVLVTLPYEANEEGLPGEEVAAELQRFEHHVLGRLGSAALLVGHETGLGRRLLHLYGERRHSITPVIEALLPAYSGRSRPTVVGQADPAWRASAHLRP